MNATDQLKQAIRELERISGCDYAKIETHSVMKDGQLVIDWIGFCMYRDSAGALCRCEMSKGDSLARMVAEAQDKFSMPAELPLRIAQSAELLAGVA